MAKPKFQIYTDAAGKFRWRLKDGDGEKVASSGDSFASEVGREGRGSTRQGHRAPDAEIED